MIDSPLGQILLAGDVNGLKAINFQEGDSPVDVLPDWQHTEYGFGEAVEQLGAYFEGRLTEFDLTLSPEGTPFYREVWAELERITYGETITYGELAARVGKPKAARAVGAANGRNPLPIVIPCHRVIGSDGSLTGYGGGLRFKQSLLELERKYRTVHKGDQLELTL
jgi:methylated-DNA-[protein]-cysteine S-methyltransferase